MSHILEQITNYNQQLSSFMHRHQKSVDTLDMEFHREFISPDLLLSLLSISEDRVFEDTEGIRHYMVSFMDISPIRIIDRTKGDFLKLSNFDYTAVYTSPPAEINIIPSQSQLLSESISRAYPIIGNTDYLDQNIYSSSSPINETGGALFDIILNDPDYEKMKTYPIAVVGAGEVGSWSMILMTMLGMTNITFYEQEDARLSSKHLGKMPYTASEQGLKKSQLMLRKLHKMNPLSNAKYLGEMNTGNLESLSDRKIIVSAADNLEVMADIHQFAYENGIDVILTTDIGKGAFGQLFKYSERKIKIFNGLISPDELRIAQRVKEGTISSDNKSTGSPILKLLGKHRMLTQFDFETIKAFLYGSKIGHFGYLPQDPSAAFTSASLTNTLIWKIITGKEIRGDSFLVDPDIETNRGALSRLLQYFNNAAQAMVIKRIKLLQKVNRLSPLVTEDIEV